MRCGRVICGVCLATGPPGICRACVPVPAPPPPPVQRDVHNKLAAALLGICLGGFGVHKFYLGDRATGIIYLVFFWTLIPGVIGFIEGINYLCMSDADFAARYG